MNNLQIQMLPEIFLLCGSLFWCVYFAYKIASYNYTSWIIKTRWKRALDAVTIIFYARNCRRVKVFYNLEINVWRIMLDRKVVGDDYNCHRDAIRAAEKLI